MPNRKVTAAEDARARYARALRKAREERTTPTGGKLTISRVAHEAQVDERTLRAWEAGHSVPHLANARALADVYGDLRFGGKAGDDLRWITRGALELERARRRAQRPARLRARLWFRAVTALCLLGVAAAIVLALLPGTHSSSQAPTSAADPGPVVALPGTAHCARIPAPALTPGSAKQVDLIVGNDRLEAERALRGLDKAISDGAVHRTRLGRGLEHLQQVGEGRSLPDFLIPTARRTAHHAFYRSLDALAPTISALLGIRNPRRESRLRRSLSGQLQQAHRAVADLDCASGGYFGHEPLRLGARRDGVVLDVVLPASRSIEPIFATTIATDVHAQATLASPVVLSLPTDTPVDIDCDIDGDLVYAPDGSASNLWHHLEGVGYVADVPIVTGSKDPIAPPCEKRSEYTLTVIERR